MEREPGGDLSLLAENLWLLLERSGEILKKPEYFFCEPSFAHASIRYLYQGPIPLGVLLGLWREDSLTVPCPECGGRVLVYCLAGSPLSGGRVCDGICSDCQQTTPRRVRPEEPFAEFALPLVRAIGQYRNEPVIERGERPRFSWGQGLVGKRKPDRVIRPAANGVPFSRLIDLLNGTLSITEIRRVGRPVEFLFDWATSSLRDTEGKVRRRVDGRWIRDPGGSATEEWDGVNLKIPGGASHYELRTEMVRGPGRIGGRIVIGTIAPLSFGHPLGLTTIIRHFDGPPVFEWKPPCLHRYQGEALYEFTDPIPLGLAILIAEGRV